MFRLFLILAVIALFGYAGWLWFDKDSEFGALPDIEATTLETGEPMAAEPVAGAEPIPVDPVIERPPVDQPMEVTLPEGEGRLNGELDERSGDGPGAEIPDTGDDQPQQIRKT